MCHYIMTSQILLEHNHLQRQGTTMCTHFERFFPCPSVIQSGSVSAWQFTCACLKIMTLVWKCLDLFYAMCVCNWEGRGHVQVLETCSKVNRVVITNNFLAVYVTLLNVFGHLDPENPSGENHHSLDFLYDALVNLFSGLCTVCKSLKMLSQPALIKGCVHYL